MPCDHIGPPELIEMAEAHLRDGNVPPESWTGRRFRYSENLDDSMWASVITEIERRGGDWIVTRLDRSKEKVARSGFESL